MANNKINPFTTLVIGLSMTLCFLLGSIIFSYFASSKLYDNVNLVERAYRVSLDLESIVLQLTEDEAAIRGYIITHDPRFVKEFDKSKTVITEEIIKLRNLIIDDSQKKRLSQLESLILKRLEILSVTIQLENSGEKDQEKMKAIVSEGQKYKEKLRDLKNIMEMEEEELIKSREHEAYLSFNNANLTDTIAAIISLVIAIFVVFIIKRENEERNKLEEGLTELNKNKNRFFSIVSHDLRGPVHGIVKLASFLKDEKRTTKEDALIMGGMIEDSARKVANLLENLLQWSKVQMNRIEFDPIKFNVKELTEVSITALQHTANLKNIKLNNKVEEHLVYGDKNMIDTVIRNLISNSIKFTEPYGEVVISSLIENNFCIIQVTDNGIGMSREVLNNLFNIETVYTSKGTANEIGSGLGLVLSKEFIEKNGGKIFIESQVNKGSTFKITIPLA